MINKDLAVGYCRFSSDNQREESIDAQKRAITKYAEENGLTIYKWYVDEAYSARTANRPGFLEMIEDSNKRAFNKLLIYKFDRFSRNDYDRAIYKHKLKMNGVKIISVMEKVDNSPQGDLMQAMLEAWATYYSNNLSNEVMKGMRENAYNCRCNGGVPPYGYKRVPIVENGILKKSKKGLELHETVIDPKNAEAVKLIFNLTLEGKTRTQVMDRLNELGFKDAKGNPFKCGTYIDRILRNERYTGTYIFSEYKQTIDMGKYHREKNETVIKIENGFPKIVEKETFLAVQKILDERVHRSPYNLNEHYLLSGKIICGECGKPFHGWGKTKNGVDYIYYKCTNTGNYYKGTRKSECCKNASIRRDDIERAVLKNVIDLLSDKNLVDTLYDEYNNYLKKHEGNDELIKNLKTQLKDTERQVENLINILANGHYIETVEQKITNLEKERNSLEQMIKQEEDKVGELSVKSEDLQKAIDYARTVLLDNSQDFEKRKTILQSFLNKVVVYKDYVEIYINVIPAKYCGNFDLSITKDVLDACKILNFEYNNNIKLLGDFPMKNIFGAPIKKQGFPPLFFSRFQQVDNFCCLGQFFLHMAKYGGRFGVQRGQ